MGEDVYRDPHARARAAELAGWPKAALVDLALDAQTGTSKASLTKCHRQVLAWTIACAEFAGHRARTATGRTGPPDVGTAPTCHPPAHTVLGGGQQATGTEKARE